MFGRFLKKSNDDKSFETACAEHMDALYASALKLTRNTSDADELVQDVYLRAFRFQKRFEPGTNLKAWLFRILTNTFINNYRHKGHERRYLERAATESVYDEVLDSHSREFAANPENHAFTQFFQRDLEQALAELPEDYRLAVVLSDMQEFSYKEISEMLGCPIGTVMSRLHRGRKMLQRELVDYAVSAGIIAPGGEADQPTELSTWRERQKGTP